MEGVQFDINLMPGRYWAQVDLPRPMSEPWFRLLMDGVAVAGFDGSTKTAEIHIDKPGKRQFVIEVVDRETAQALAAAPSSYLSLTRIA